MIQHGRRDPRLLDHGILVQQRPHPAQIHRIGLDRQAPYDDAGIGGKVRNGIEDLARRARVAVELFDARVDDLERRRHVVRGPQHVEYRHPGPLQR